MKRQHPTRSGYLLIEVAIAAGLVIIIAVVFVHLAIGSFGLERRGRDNTVASNIAQEGLEAARSIANRNFSELTIGTHGLDATNGVYLFAGTSNTVGAFSRTVTVAGVQRNSNGDIVQSGGADDPATRVVTSTVTWTPSQQSARTVNLTTYFTQWKPRKWISDTFQTFQSYGRNSTQLTAADDGGATLLVAATMETLTPFLTRDVRGSADVTEVAVDPIRNRLYIALKNNSGTNPEFVSYDISDISRGSMTEIGAIDFGGNKGSRGFAVGKDYAYVLTDGPEILVVRLRDFIVVQTWNLPGNANPMDVVLNETAQRLYVGRKKGGNDPELTVMNTARPDGAAVTVATSYIDEDVNALGVRGNFAYIASGRLDGEVFTVDLTTMTKVRCDLPGDEDAVAIQIVGDSLFVGRNGGGQHEFAEYAISPISPGNCPILPLSSSNLGTDDVFAMSILSSEGYAVLAVNDNDAEVRLVKFSNFLQVGSRRLDSNKCDAITFFGAYIFAGCRDGESTLEVLEATSVRARKGTITSTPFDASGEPTNWKKISWTKSGPGSVSLRIRTASSLLNLEQAVWVGSDGTTGTVYQTGGVAGQTIVTDPAASGTRYIQWQATLVSSGTETPVLEDVSLTYP